MFLGMVNQQVCENRLARPRGSKDQGAELIALMQIKVERRSFIGLKHYQVLAPQMVIHFLAAIWRIRERQVGIVATEQPGLSQAERMIAWNDRDRKALRQLYVSRNSEPS